MRSIPYIDIHTHQNHSEKDTVLVQNIYPGEGIPEFSGRNFYSVGLHPWHLASENENNAALELVEEALELDHFIFVGEAGLDKLVDADFNEQKRVFKAQAYIAEEYQYPLIVHCVKAFNEVIELRKKMNPAMPWILHAYNGSLDLTKQLEKMNFMFSFGNNLLKDNLKAIQAFQYLDLNNLFFETDELELDVNHIYERAAKLKKISEQQLKIATWDNLTRIQKSLASN